MDSRQSYQSALNLRIDEFNTQGNSPYRIDFQNSSWVEYISGLIHKFKAEQSYLIAGDVVFSLATPLSYYLPLIFIPTQLAYLLIIRSLLKKNSDYSLEKLCKIFLLVRSTDTHYSIVKELAEAIAPYVADNKIIEQWIKTRIFPFQAIDEADSDFKNILDEKGFLKAIASNDEQEADNDYHSVLQEYNSIEKKVKLLQSKIRLNFYGKGSIYTPLSGNKYHNFYSRQEFISVRTSSDNEHGNLYITHDPLYKFIK